MFESYLGRFLDDVVIGTFMSREVFDPADAHHHDAVEKVHIAVHQAQDEVRVGGVDDVGAVGDLCRRVRTDGGELPVSNDDDTVGNWRVAVAVDQDSVDYR
ncbi:MULTISPECIES: hypothetical protein [Mycobacteriaceae]|uniref:hypothetical protein n=1 Tax=Mycobacteriaceae TaxID=1762 RepID=UPI00104909CC|nr:MULTISPECIES: hypothetical protein [Mycobacteriaceae]QZH61233.1 hypothetical protein K1X22_05560 [Mycolicibacterium farcinogenes]